MIKGIPRIPLSTNMQLIPQQSKLIMENKYVDQNYKE